jgi:hypothetical protein
VNFGGFERLFERERRQDRGHALGQHGFAGTGRADHQDVVASGAGHFQGALGGLLPADFFKVDAEVLCFAEQSVAIDLQGMYAIAVVHEMDHVNKGANGKDFHPPDHGGFTGVQFGDDKAGDFSGTGLDGDGERAADGANASVQRKLADEKAIGNLLLIQSAIGTEDAESHRKVEAGAFFADVGGGEVNGYVSERIS